MKYLVLILVAFAVGASLRYQANEIAKGMYLYGCEDAALKLKRLHRDEASKEITDFCEARRESLDKFMPAFGE